MNTHTNQWLGSLTLTENPGLGQDVIWEVANILQHESRACLWPDGLLDAYFDMIPESEGDASPIGQRPSSVFPVIGWPCAVSEMCQLS